MSGFLSQLGLKREATYGTEVVVDRFLEFDSESIKPVRGRLESRANRAGSRGLRSNRWQPITKGGAGNTPMPIPTKGFGIFGELMMGGTVVTTGPDANGLYTHTWSPGTLNDKSATVQVNKPFEQGTNYPVTCAGGKIANWKIGCELDQYAGFDPAWDFQKVTRTTALAVASYAVAAEMMSFVGGTVTVAGTSIDVKSAEVSRDPKMKTDDFPVNSGFKRQPRENDLAEVAWSLGLFWDSSTQYDRVMADTADGADAAIVLTFRGPTPVVTTAYPTLTLTMPNGTFHDGDPEVSGPGLLDLPVSGIATNTPGANDNLSMAYKTLDATP